jgi:ribosomal-protein-alanine N-acetyltransferase
MRKLRNPTLRLASPHDAAPIAAMSRELIEAGLGWSWTPERVQRCLRHCDTLVLTARDGERLTGFAIMLFGDERAHLSLLAVHSDYRHQGVGAQMLEWLTQSALGAGISTLHLELREGNRGARAFYIRQGFSETARIPGYYRGVETAVRMLRDIRVK